MDPTFPAEIEPRQPAPRRVGPTWQPESRRPLVGRIPGFSVFTSGPGTAPTLTGRAVDASVSIQPTTPDRPAEARPSGVLVGVRSPGRPGGAGVPPRGGEPLQERGEPPIVQLIQPKARNIVRVVGQPSFVESLRAPSVYPEDERLHQAVEGGHRRQGQEGPTARLPLRARAGRGTRDEEGRP